MMIIIIIVIGAQSEKSSWPSLSTSTAPEVGAQHTVVSRGGDINYVQAAPRVVSSELESLRDFISVSSL